MNRVKQYSILFIFLNLLASSTGFAGEAKNFRLITYNVWGLPSPLLVKSKRFDIIKDDIANFKADVIVFQETFSSKTEPLETIKGYPYVAKGPAREKGLAKQNSGLMIVSRWPLVKVERLKFSACKGMDCLSAKGALFVRVDVPEIGEIDIITTHLNAGPKNHKTRASQTEEILDFARAHSGNRPLIVAGDFNMDPQDSPYWMMTNYFGSVDTHAEFVADHPELDPVQKRGYTMDPKRGGYYKIIAPFYKPRRLDYVFYKDQGCEQAFVTDSSLIYDWAVKKTWLSDHFGVKTDFQILPCTR